MTRCARLRGKTMVRHVRAERDAARYRRHSAPKVQRIVADPSFRSALLDKYVGEALVVSPEELAALIRSEREIWGKVIREANLKGD